MLEQVANSTLNFEAVRVLVISRRIFREDKFVTHLRLEKFAVLRWREKLVQSPPYHHHFLFHRRAQELCGTHHGNKKINDQRGCHDFIRQRAHTEFRNPRSRFSMPRIRWPTGTCTTTLGVPVRLPKNQFQPGRTSRCRNCSRKSCRSEMLYRTIVPHASYPCRSPF